MGHARFNDDAELLGGDAARVRGPLVWDKEDTGALIYAMVCQSIGHDNTVAREVEPLELAPGPTEWEIELQRCSGEPFIEGMAAATALAIFTNTEGEFASYSWTDCVHLQAGTHHSENRHPGTVAS
jgi:hypothetical protein